MADQAPEHISPAQVTLGAAAILVNACISISMQLGIEWQLSIAAVRFAASVADEEILYPLFGLDFGYLDTGTSCGKCSLKCIEELNMVWAEKGGNLPHVSHRCVVQLSVLGYILLPIFSYNFWWLVIAYGFFMLLVGSWEATSKPTQTYKVRLMLISHAFSARNLEFYFTTRASFQIQTMF